MGSLSYPVVGLSDPVPRKLRMLYRPRVFDSAGMRYTGRTGTNAIGGLHVCPRCDSNLVQPTRWEQTDERGRWRLWRRCPDCDWRCEGVHGEREIDAYDRELDIGAEALADLLKELERESMRNVAAAFSAALAADLITADDFRRPAQL
jgi:hypothetical protein